MKEYRDLEACLLRSLGGGTIGATEGVGAGRDLSWISACRDCKGWSSSGSNKAAWELVATLSDVGLFPLLLPPVEGSVLPFLGGFNPPSLIVITRALFRGNISIKEVADRLLDSIRRAWLSPLKVTIQLRVRVADKGRLRRTFGESRVHSANSGFSPKVTEPFSSLA
ncbi:hypothetical protein H5410_041388 [Solanum commersonii]|uniref:Uncharacterized protein n=1 Tax=Solanum commersonii TaxID=4109 RepID=A0A9J5XSX4_SOLCO|nr:hypothetical protein H5410_041388 [Solanum commersonii]